MTIIIAPAEFCLRRWDPDLRRAPADYRMICQRIGPCPFCRPICEQIAEGVVGVLGLWWPGTLAANLAMAAVLRAAADQRSDRDRASRWRRVELAAERGGP